MEARTKTLLILAFGTLLGLALDAQGPIGRLVYPAYSGAGSMSPDAAQLPFLIGVSIIQALAFGFGLAILIDGPGLLRAAAPSHPLVARGAHLAIVWLLMSWVPHGSLHEHIGPNVWNLIAVEYGFHVTLILAGVMVARFFYVTLEEREDQMGADVGTGATAAR